MTCRRRGRRGIAAATPPRDPTDAAARAPVRDDHEIRDAATG